MRSLAAVLLAACAGSALAHVTANPLQAPVGAFQRYAIRVPSEKAAATVKVEVEFPAQLRVSETEALSGWRTQARKNDKGDITTVTWDNGAIAGGQFVEFGVIARNPDAPTELVWKAIQTYQDGSEVHWVGPRDAQYPASVTRVVAREAGDDAGTRVIEWISLALALLALIIAVAAWFRPSKR